MTRRRLLSTVAPVVALVACGSGSDGSPPSACPGAAALWAAADYGGSAAVGSISLAGRLTSVVGRVDLGGDPAMSVSAGRAFYVARDQDAIFELDACGVPKQRFSAHVAGHGGSDPYGVAVAHDGTLWVPLYLGAAVLLLHPDGTVARTIDLSSYDGDGNPEASDIAILDTPAGEKAFVTLDRLDPYPKSVQSSLMLRIDVANAHIEDVIVLEGRNPYSMTLDGAILWLSEPGNWDDATEPDAGIERFDTSTSTTALVVPEARLGGSVGQVAVSGSCGVAVVGDATAVTATSLVTFDANTGAAIATASRSPLATAGFDLGGLSWVGGDLLVGDRRRAAGGYPIHVFSGNAACTLMERTNPLFVPMQPVAVLPLP